MKELFIEIRSRLDGDVAAAAIGTTLAKVHAEMERQRAAKSMHEAKTIDLLADQSDVVAADRALSEAILNERRLCEASRQLAARQTAREQIETEAARVAAYTKAKSIRDDAVAKISQAWCAHANGLVSLAQYIGDVDAEIRSVRSEPPRGCEQVSGVLDGISSMGGSPNAWRSILDHLSLPEIPQWDALGFKGSQIMRL